MRHGVGRGGTEKTGIIDAAVHSPRLTLTSHPHPQPHFSPLTTHHSPLTTHHSPLTLTNHHSTFTLHPNPDPDHPPEPAGAQRRLRGEDPTDHAAPRDRDAPRMPPRARTPRTCRPQLYTTLSPRQVFVLFTHCFEPRLGQALSDWHPEERLIFFDEMLVT